MLELNLFINKFLLHCSSLIEVVAFQYDCKARRIRARCLLINLIIGSEIFKFLSCLTLYYRIIASLFYTIYFSLF